ncbi:hypothetical protein Asppvi_006683 [Aspergillus pseudoviridinutans]|uniref:Uncharacterized protein n=1 Tax=Aspergillus pseudoviridinutans TaxID=1517512 RepID=A0A9P3BBE7_9EURO|nr:uncharacterized protein Asppvi_006683 [Aspergillus pseudoviridinutans]GIJ87770.1 hypothetical protein Asppvi_006683 [Aspergillus pseudoviridinutans]
MPTPERNADWLPSSRRMYEQQQQRSPFSRARGNSRAAEDFDTSRIPSPSYKYTTQRRTNFNETNTLTGAFRKAGRYATMAENEGISVSVPYVRGTPSPGRRRQIYNARSPESNPPNELAEAYRQIDDADSLADLEPEDAYGQEDKIGRSSGYYARDYDVFTTSDVSFLHEVQDESPRRRLSDHIQDEKRLRRATTSHSPVLSNRGGTKNALTAENLQRREEEDQLVSGDDDTFQHELNVPSTWGSRAKRNTDWLRKLKRRDEPEPEPEPEPEQRPERPVNVSPPVTKLNFDFRTSPGRSLEPASSRYSRIPLSDARNKLSSEQRDDKPIGGNTEPIANTPVIVYKNSSFTKPSPSKRDSHDLIRRLARRESPDQNRNQQELRTPEAPKGGQRRIYDKTPVVTGAWIDTPMTERISERTTKMSEELTNGFRSQVVSDDLKPVIPEMEEEAEVEVKGLTQERERDAERNRQEQQEREREKEQEKARMEEEQEKARKENEEKEKEAKRHEEEREKKVKPPLIKPDLPKSALESVIQEHKADKETLDVGDDTIESLQELLAEQATEAKAGPQSEAAYEKEIMERLERSHGDEDVGDHKISEKLLSLEENQDTLRKKIDGVEEQMTQSMPKAPEDSPRPTSSQAQTQLKRAHAGKTCETCGAEDDGRIYASIPLPLLWKRDPISRRIRITRLGWALLLSLLWFVSESTMCDYYCHPTVAPICEGNCLRPDAPRFPFVLPTMLWRWSHLSSALAPVATLGIAFIRLLAQLLGLWDGYVDVPPRTLNLSGEVRIYGTRITHSPVTATATPGFFARQWPVKELRHTPEAMYTPEAVPELRLEEELPRDVWDDDSMDDDELL